MGGVAAAPVIWVTQGTADAATCGDSPALVTWPAGESPDAGSPVKVADGKLPRLGRLAGVCAPLAVAGEPPGEPLDGGQSAAGVGGRRVADAGVAELKAKERAG